MVKRALLAVTCALLSTQSIAQGQDVQGPGAVPAPAVALQDLNESARPNFIPGDLEVFLDGAISPALVQNDVSGLTIAVVKDGGIIFTHGYGLANIKDEDPVSTNNTLFRIGSISKTFTWIAIMQLMERGHLDLNDPVNLHLPPDLHIPDDGFRNPVRIKHLMNHTPGFEDRVLGHLFFKDPRDVPAPDDYLRQYQPMRVREPGQIASYSNYGVALAGAIIGHVSGQDFEDYIRDNILTPLKMQRTTFKEPGRGYNGPASFAEGAIFSTGMWQDAPFAYISHVAAAGSASSTADDMARYMAALLNLETGFQGLLKPQSARMMRQASFSNTPSSPPIRHGLFSYQFGALGGLGHDGGTLSFVSTMVLVPEINVGIFVSSNAQSGRDIVATLPRLIMERYFPEHAATQDGPTTTPASLQDYVGTFLTNRRPYSGFEKLLIGLTGLTQVRLSQDGALLVQSGLGNVERWNALKKDVFISKDGNQHLTFTRDGEGRIQWLSSGYGVTAAQRISVFYTPISTFGLLLLTSLSAVGLLFGIWTAKENWANEPKALKWALIVRTSTAALWVLYALSLIITLAGMTALNQLAVFAYPTPMVFITLVLGGLVFLGTLFSTAFTWSVWRKPAWTLDRQLLHSFIHFLWGLTLIPLIWWGAISMQL